MTMLVIEFNRILLGVLYFTYFLLYFTYYFYFQKIPLCNCALRLSEQRKLHCTDRLLYSLKKKMCFTIQKRTIYKK